MKLIKNYTRHFLLIFMAFFLLTPFSVMAESNNDNLNYVALGDSLAAGYLNDPPLTIGKGYPVFIKERIEEEKQYNVILSNNGVGAYTTVDVLNQVRTDVNVQSELAKADLITLDIGANDLLGVVGALEDLDVEDEDAVAELITNVMSTLEQVEGNMDQIFDEITSINNDAPVYVMGYYNALHYLEGDLLQTMIMSVMGQLNQIIESVGANHGAYYVPTFDTFEGKYEEYLPQPDIHPNELGYEVIADQFLQQIIPDLAQPDMESPVITLIGENPMELEVGETYEEPGATAEDDVDGDVTDQIEVSGEVDTSKAGECIVTYTVSDAAGNLATVTRIVKIVEVEGPDNGEGEDGEDGADGVDGEDGADGVDGEDGADGVDGEDGADGVDGETDEKVVTVSTNGSDNKTNQKAAEATTSSQSNMTKDHGSGTLPATATNNPLFIALGISLLIAGGAIFVIRRKRLN